MDQEQTTEARTESRIIANVEASLARLEAAGFRKPRSLPAEPKPRRRDIGGPFAWDVVH